jgi:undecaprenyl-diphosphatase
LWLVLGLVATGDGVVGRGTARVGPGHVHVRAGELTGLVLWWTDRARPEGLVRIGATVAIGVGAVQALALLPGLSRSGPTIAIALALGMRRDAGAQYSFFLAIPTILAATAVQAADVARAGDPVSLSLASVAVGFLVAAVVGAVRSHWCCGCSPQRSFECYRST